MQVVSIAILSGLTFNSNMLLISMLTVVLPLLTNTDQPETKLRNEQEKAGIGHWLSRCPATMTVRTSTIYRNIYINLNRGHEKKLLSAT